MPDIFRESDPHALGSETFRETDPHIPPLTVNELKSFLVSSENKGATQRRMILGASETITLDYSGWTTETELTSLTFESLVGDITLAHKVISGLVGSISFTPLKKGLDRVIVTAIAGNETHIQHIDVLTR